MIILTFPGKKQLSLVIPHDQETTGEDGRDGRDGRDGGDGEDVRSNDFSRCSAVMAIAITAAISGSTTYLLGN